MSFSAIKCTRPPAEPPTDLTLPPVTIEPDSLIVVPPLLGALNNSNTSSTSLSANINTRAESAVNFASKVLPFVTVVPESFTTVPPPIGTLYVSFLLSVSLSAVNNTRVESGLIA